MFMTGFALCFERHKVCCACVTRKKSLGDLPAAEALGCHSFGTLLVVRILVNTSVRWQVMLWCMDVLRGVMSMCNVEKPVVLKHLFHSGEPNVIKKWPKLKMLKLVLGRHLHTTIPRKKKFDA